MIPSKHFVPVVSEESSIIWKHALKNALPPIVTVLGLQLASAFTGAILTESTISMAWYGYDDRIRHR